MRNVACFSPSRDQKIKNHSWENFSIAKHAKSQNAISATSSQLEEKIENFFSLILKTFYFSRKSIKAFVPLPKNYRTHLNTSYIIRYLISAISYGNFKFGGYYYSFPFQKKFEIPLINFEK